MIWVKSVLVIFLLCGTLPLGKERYEFGFTVCCSLWLSKEKLRENSI